MAIASKKKQQTGAAGERKLAQEQVEKVWKRARSNAFAHRAAAEKFQILATALFLVQIFSSVAGIILVLLVYVVSSTSPEKIAELDFLELFFDVNRSADVLIIQMTLFSVLFSVIALCCSIYQNFAAVDRRAAIHNHNQHSYLYIAQRAREISFAGIDTEKARAVLEDIERDFQILKARGQEPNDSDFRKGNRILYNIQHNLPEGELQSFTHPGGDFKTKYGKLLLIEKWYLRWRFGYSKIGTVKSSAKGRSPKK